MEAYILFSELSSWELTLAHHQPVTSENIRYHLQMALCRDMARLCLLPRQEKRDCRLSDTISQKLCSLTFIEMDSLVLQAEAVLEPHWLNRRFFNDNIKKQSCLYMELCQVFQEDSQQTVASRSLVMQDKGRMVIRYIVIRWGAAPSPSKVA